MPLFGDTLMHKGDRVEGIETTKGFIKSNKIGVVAAGHSSVIADMAGLRLPLESKPLQALVSEPVKPSFFNILPTPLRQIIQRST